MDMTKDEPKKFITNSFDNSDGTDAIRLVPSSAIKVSLDNTDPIVGVTKKFSTTLGDTEYITKNHSYIGFDDHKKKSLLGRVKRSFGKNIKHVTAGTVDIRYRYTGTPIDIINLMSVREVLTSSLLTAVEKSATRNNEPPFHTARMQLLLDHYPETKLIRVQVLSKKLNFTALNHYIYSAATSLPLPIKKGEAQQKDSYAILNNNSWTENDKPDLNAEQKPIDPRSLAFAAILPAIFADYDLPGSKGQNIGVTKSDSKLAFFDFGHSLSPSWLKQKNVTSDLKVHDFYITGKLNSRRTLSLTKPENLIRHFRGKHIINAPIEDKIEAFKEFYDTFIDSAGKENNVIKGIKYECAKIFQALADEGMITQQQLKYYKSKTFKSLDRFTARLKHIHKIVAPRLNLSVEQLRLLDTIELLASRTIPTPLSKTGLVIHNDKSITGITNRHTFEYHKNDLVTGSKEGANRIAFFLERESHIKIKPHYKNGLYHIPLRHIPAKWEKSPFTQSGKEVVNNLLNSTNIATNIYNKHSSIFNKKMDVTTPSNEDMNRFIEDILKNINDIKETANSHSLSKASQQRLIFRFLNENFLNENESKLDENSSKHGNIWQAVHALLEKEKATPELKLNSLQQLKMLDKQFAPEQRNALYDLSVNGMAK